MNLVVEGVIQGNSNGGLARLNGAQRNPPPQRLGWWNIMEEYAILPPESPVGIHGRRADMLDMRNRRDEITTFAPSSGESLLERSLPRIERLLVAILIVQTLFFAEESLEFVLKHFR